MFEGKLKPSSEVIKTAVEVSEHTVSRRETLKDFVDHPFTVTEIISKRDYYAHIHNDIAAALIQAGYAMTEVSALIQKSFEAIDFKQPTEKFVADINRVISNFYQAAPLAGPRDSEVTAQVSLTTADQSVSATGAKEMVTNQMEVLPPTDTLSVRQLANQLEQAELENPEHAAEYFERTASPQRVVPIFHVQTISSEVTPLTKTDAGLVSVNPVGVLSGLENATPTHVVETNLEPETVVETVSGEKLTGPAEGVSDYQQQLEILNEAPFNQDQYVELAYGLFAQSRSAYDTVLKNPKLYRDKIYNPSANEQAAIVLRGRMQKHHSRMRLLRQSVVECLENTGPSFSETEVKFLLAKFAVESQKLLAEAQALTQLYETIKTEDTPPLAEIYRTQLDKMRIEGNQVLATVPDSNPLYHQFKFVIENDLESLIKFASVAAGGNQNVLEQSAVFMVRRERIKAAVAYMKMSQEFADFQSRIQKRIQELSLAVADMEMVPASLLYTKTALQNRLTEISSLLAEDNYINPEATLAFVVTDNVNAQTEALDKQKTAIQNAVGEAQVMFTVLSGQTEEEPEIETTKPLPLILSEANRLPAQINSLLATRLNTIRSSKPETVAQHNRVHAILARLKPRKIGLITALAAFVATLPATAPKTAGSESGLLDQTFVTSAPLQSGGSLTFDYNEVFTSLRSLETTPQTLPETLKSQLTASTATQLFAQTDLPQLQNVLANQEAVPGVFFTARSEQIKQPSNPDLKIFSQRADQVPADDGIEFITPVEHQPDTLYKINFGDRFWDINEGQTLAGNLAVMSQINPYFKQALIDKMRDQINKDGLLRTKIGGLGDQADMLLTGQHINLTELNRLAKRLAVEYGYLN